MSKKKKRIITIFVLIALIVTASILLTSFLSDDSAPTLVISKNTATPGEEIYVAVSAKNNPGISGFAVELTYDNQILTPVEIIREGLVAQGMFESNVGAKALSEPVKVTWFDVTDIREDGDLFTIKFRVSASASGKAPLSIQYEEGNIANQELETVYFNVKKGEVKVKR